MSFSLNFFFFFSSRRRHTRSLRDWSSDVCSSDLQPFARVVQPPHRIHALGTFLHQLHHRRPPLGIPRRGHVTLWLVQHKIQKPLPAFQRLTIHANHVAFRIGFRALFQHHFSVERHPPRRNDLLGLAPRRNPARR